ncbi:hypothetical protein EJB05_43231, partial [Eragrostis curvula]
MPLRSAWQLARMIRSRLNSGAPFGYEPKLLGHHSSPPNLLYPPHNLHRHHMLLIGDNGVTQQSHSPCAPSYHPCTLRAVVLSPVCGHHISPAVLFGASARRAGSRATQRSPIHPSIRAAATGWIGARGRLTSPHRPRLYKGPATCGFSPTISSASSSPAPPPVFSISLELLSPLHTETPRIPELDQFSQTVHLIDMAAQSWRSLLCCSAGGGAVEDDDSTPRRRRITRRGKDSPRSSSRMSFTSLSSSGTITPEDLSLTLSGSNLHAFTYAELRAVTATSPAPTTSAAAGLALCTRAPSRKAPAGPARADGGHQAEVFFLGQLRHKNLVKLIGYCYEAEHRMLVYEFMSYGSLENHLFKSINDALPWMTRMKIAVGAAKGLAFLHDSDPPVIYRDFKASNILLDSYSCKGAEVAAIVAYKCLSQNPKSRPTMREVVKALEPVLDMDDFFPVGPFVFTISVEEDKVVDMKVEVEEKHRPHHQSHQERHREKYPNSSIHAGIVLHSRDGVVGGYSAALRQHRRTSSYNQERGA